ncbi:class I SAM-dependent methyltransferase [Lentzea sp. NPDC058436]|uniref:class I SAM-dependent methyltransferase n=1 Tax=Lentzea sp. NPDC058436 TaxID=3346499 RepID=UPI003654D859
MTNSQQPTPPPADKAYLARSVQRKLRDVSVSVDFERLSYIDAPRPEQRHWVTNRAVDELVEQLRHLDVTAPGYVGGASRREIDPGQWSGSTATYVDGELLIEDQQVMQDWEIPLMRRMAEVVAAGHGDVLEIGFGLGLSAGFIEDCGVNSHTIVELNAEVADVARAWAATRPESDIVIAEGSWQEQTHRLGLFDGVFWDAFPTSESEFDQYVLRDSTVAEAFFPFAAAHLRPGGVFTYYTNERDSLSRRHQRNLLRYFSSFGVELVSGLRPPDDCEYWWADSMCVVRAVK